MTDIFKEGDAGNSGAPTQNEGDKSTFDFIGEGKQYASPEVALAAIPHKDAHIANIEKENAEMRAKLAESKSLEDVLAALKTGGNENTNDTQVNTDANTNAPDIAETVESVLQERDEKAREQGNVATVSAFMVETFGDKAQEVAHQKAAELGMSLTELRNIAVRSPAAYKALFTTKQVDSGVPSTKGDVNTQAVNTPAPTGEKAYLDLIKVDKKKFLSPEVQIAQMEEAMADPDKFFNTN